MRGIGILGNLGKLEELGGIIGDIIIVPNGTNVERELSGEGGIGILGNLDELGIL